MTTDTRRAHGLHKAAPAPLSFTDRLYALRDRLLGSQQFQRFSASFFLTRPIARRQAGALFDLCAGFVYSQILAACVDLDLFRRLRAEPQTGDKLARDLGIPGERLSRLLDGAVSLRLLSRRRGNRYGLGMLGAALVDNPGIAAMVQHHGMLYRDLANPVTLLRDRHGQTELSRFWGYAGAADAAALAADDVAAYSALMASSQSFIAADVLDAYRFDTHRCVMDVGGGEGAFIAAAAAKHPQLTFKVFDLPAVADRARTRLAALGDRVAVHGGSFVDDPLPRGADLITLVRVVHDHDDAVVRQLLRAAYDALPPGGKLLIAEPMAGAPGAGQVGAAYFGFYLMAMGSGRARTSAELTALLVAAGFTKPRVLTTHQPLLTGAIVAEKQVLSLG
ncbi:MAG: methyltransferase [Pseudolabrys sp.]|nr:methyltransferase [Pseudolabrys sp.]